MCILRASIMCMGMSICIGEHSLISAGLFLPYNINYRNAPHVPLTTTTTALCIGKNSQNVLPLLCLSPSAGLLIYHVDYEGVSGCKNRNELFRSPKRCRVVVVQSERGKRKSSLGFLRVNRNFHYTRKQTQCYTHFIRFSLNIMSLILR